MHTHIHTLALTHTHTHAHTPSREFSGSSNGMYPTLGSSFRLIWLNGHNDFSPIMQSYLNDIELKLTRVVERNFRTLRRGLLFSTPSRLFVNMQMRLGESRQL